MPKRSKLSSPYLGSGKPYFGSAFDRDLITPVVPRPARWIAWTLPMEQDGSLPDPGLAHSSEDRFDEALSLTVATPPMVGWEL
jgi:hypothetical protein